MIKLQQNIEIAESETRLGNSPSFLINSIKESKEIAKDSETIILENSSPLTEETKEI